MSGPLLNANYIAYQVKSVSNLLSKVQIFEMYTFGDGATVMKTPTNNVLTLPVLLEIPFVFWMFWIVLAMQQWLRKMMHSMFARKCCRK
jgi:hypothetical protein